ncbi:glycosyltransferase family 2 protein [Pedobacter sp. KBW06]|uniref:glycosyltransferase family 2 protein n=1 Tax=Pedobacter sp. KBW06 TaxID=2153359 RepID=UPI0013156F77|nr:glycosyltransferase [Pedobacter sp. KBW06]
MKKISPIGKAKRANIYYSFYTPMSDLLSYPAINPVITLVIPLFNAERYLIETLNSVKFQSYREWQCIIIDDGSTDHSIDLTQEYIANDKRFLLIKRKDRTLKKGANSCRNLGLKQTVTNWVMFLDADDLLEEDCLKNRMLAIESNLSNDMYVFKTAFIDNDKNIKGTFSNPDPNIEDIIYRLLKHQVPWHTMSPVWRKDFLQKTGGWNEDYERLQDIELNLRAVLQKPAIYFATGDYDSFYRFLPMSDEKKKAARFGFCRILKDYYHPLLGNDWISEEYKIKLQESFQQLIERQLINYINNVTGRDLPWEELYMETLNMLNLEVEEIDAVQRLFNKMA